MSYQNCYYVFRELLMFCICLCFRFAYSFFVFAYVRSFFCIVSLPWCVLFVYLLCFALSGILFCIFTLRWVFCICFLILFEFCFVSFFTLMSNGHDMRIAVGMIHQFNLQTVSRLGKQIYLKMKFFINLFINT